MKVCSCSPQKTQQNSILSFLAPPYRLALAKVMLDNYPGRAMQCRLSCSLPPLQTLLPSPDQLPSTALYRHLSSRSATGAVINGCWTGWLLARAGYVSPCCKSCVYGICAFVLRCFFSVLTLYSPMEHSLGVNFFFSSSLSSCKSCIFLNTLSSCSVYSVVICMLCMYGQGDG